MCMRKVQLLSMTTSNNKDVQRKCTIVNAHLQQQTCTFKKNAQIVNCHLQHTKMFKKIHNCQPNWPPPTTKMYEKILHYCQCSPPTTNMQRKIHKWCYKVKALGFHSSLAGFFFNKFFYLNGSISRDLPTMEKTQDFFNFSNFFFGSQLQTAAIVKLKLRVCQVKLVPSSLHPTSTVSDSLFLGPWCHPQTPLIAKHEYPISKF